ncbi:MAG: VCBS repeat-containing protein, partial [Muribaculaceae bacterium]|nr:VCBS repeat-containing protein [Muribaculaceae bacterium]
MFGRIPYDVSLASNGQTHVSVPLETFSSEYESDHGISLIYNNSSKISPMGYGWSLGGLPKITRSGRNFFTDGTTSGVRLDENNFSLNNVRLLLQQTEASGTRIYRTQIGNTKAVLDSDGHFTVFNPDGSRDYFMEHDSLQHYVTRHVPLDRQETTYTYRQSAGHKVLDTVSYGEGRILRMHYGPAGGTDSLYVAGVAILPRLKLKSVTVEREGRVLARYQLHYKNKSDVEDPLRGITLSDSLEQPILPLRFAYHAPGESDFSWTRKRLTQHFVCPNNDLSKIIISRGRFDYGCEDEGLLMYPNRVAYRKNTNSNQTPLYSSQYLLSDSIIATTKMNFDDLYIGCYTMPTEEGFVEALAMDVDGYKGDELVRINNVVEGDSDIVKLNVFDSRYGLDFREAGESIFWQPAISHSVRPKSFIPGDFNGDGRTDMLIISHSNPNDTCDGNVAFVDFSDSIPSEITRTFTIDSCYLDCPSWSGQNPDPDAMWQCYNNSDRLVVLDVEGCGRHQLGVVNEHGMYIYSFEAGHNGQLSMWMHKAGIPLTRTDLQNSELTTGDFNGDGITDLAVLEQGFYAKYKIYLGKGNGDFVLKDSSQYNTQSNTNHYAVADVDRDGKSDIFVQPPYSDGPQHVFLSGDRWQVQDIRIPGGSYTAGCNTYGDGHNYSLVSVGYDGEVTFHRYDDPADARRTLALISDSVGLEHTFTHGRLYYHDDTPYFAYTSDFPFSSFAEGQLVCAGHRVTATSDTISNVSYQYSLPVIHRQGLGFCGFEKLFSTDSVSGRKEFIYNVPQNLGATREMRLCNGTTDIRLTKWNNRNVVDEDRHITIVTDSKIVTDFAKQVADSAAYTYDNYSNLASEAHSLTGSITRDITYGRLSRDTLDLSGTKPYVIGLETLREETLNASGRSVTTGHRTEYGGNGLVSSEYDYHDTESNRTLSRSYTHDIHGRLTETSTVAYTGTPLRRRFTYLGDSRLPKAVSDEWGMLSTYTWGDYGLLKKETGPSFEVQEPEPIPGGILILGGGTSEPNTLGGGAAGGNPGALIPDWPTLSERWYYNTLGQVDSIVSPQGQVTRYNRSWDSPSGVKAIRFTETSTDGRPAEKSWYDALGRCVRHAVQRFDGQWLTADTVYDTRGRVAKVSLPSRSNERQWTVFTYDNRDRMTSAAYPDGHTDLMTHNGLTTTTTTDGVTTTRTLNALGLLVNLTDAAGTTVAYDLYPEGRPAAVSVGGLASTTFEYDDYGRPTAINDPSAGRRVKQYDSGGNVVRETDARGKWVAAAFDGLHRPVSFSSSDGDSARVTYDVWGSPVSITDGRGHSSSWTYDDLRRLHKETVDGYSRTYTYDGMARVESVTHAADSVAIGTERYEYSNGGLTKITLDGVGALWRLMSERDNGKPAATTKGFLQETRDYDLRGNMVQYQVLRGQVRPIPVQYYSYDTATGNMAGRTFFGRHEPFTYDCLNRLTGDSVRTFTYDGLGNLTCRGGAGTLAYGGDAPYAVNFLNPDGAMVPLREQRLSFNARQLPDSISENGLTATFGYRGDGSLAEMVITDMDGDTVRSVTYCDRLETRRLFTGGTAQEKKVLWLGGTPYDAPVALVKDYGSDTWALHRVLRDNQGSLLAVTDANGLVQQRMDYDAWGALRDPATGTHYGPDAQPELLLGHGYTGHEHLPEFGLINMNARLYDPALGRFLSPDPVVQAPDDTQSFNRYSYCLNNPLRYTDPTGLKWLMSKFGNEYFFFFDENVNDIMQLNTTYGFNSDITILDDDIVVIIRDKETGETLNEFDLYPNGDFSIDGVNQTQEYNNNGLLHIG